MLIASIDVNFAQLERAGETECCEEKLEGDEGDGGVGDDPSR